MDSLLMATNEKIQLWRRLRIRPPAMEEKMPTRQHVDEILRFMGFKRQSSDGRPNTYAEAQRSTPLAASWRYQHDDHSRWSPTDPDGAVYVHAIEIDDDAVLVANHIYRDRLLKPNKQIASPSGTLTRKTSPEDGYRGDALWRALIVLARETK